MKRVKSLSKKLLKKLGRLHIILWIVWNKACIAGLVELMSLWIFGSYLVKCGDNKLLFDCKELKSYLWSYWCFDSCSAREDNYFCLMQFGTV